MELETLGLIAAGVGLVATILYVVLGFKGVKVLKDIKGKLDRKETRS